MTHEDIQGWFDFGPIYDRAVGDASDGAVIAEVGCWLGRSTAYLGQRVRESGKRITVWAVDHGFGTLDSVMERPLHDPVLRECGGNVMGRMASNLLGCGVYEYVNPLVLPSLRAAALFPDGHFDLVFLDAAHDYESVRADIQAWWPKVKTSGVLAGHDYDQGWCGVRRAVDEFFCTELNKDGAVNRDVPSCWSRVK